jgi:hypothetical protein
MTGDHCLLRLPGSAVLQPAFQGPERGLKHRATLNLTS